MSLKVSHCRLIGMINGCELRICRLEGLQWHDIHTKFHQNSLIDAIRIEGIRHTHKGAMIP
jgi:hypothetical protein